MLYAFERRPPEGRANTWKELLAELDEMAKDEEVWTAKMTVLKENVEHHVEEEEGEMFPQARKALTKEEIESLGVRLDAARKKQKAAAH